MRNFREDMAPVEGHDGRIKYIQENEEVPWAIKYLARPLSTACKEKYPDCESKGIRIELPWPGQVRYKEDGPYDDYTYIHELAIDVFSEGSMKGRIKSIKPHHWVHYHTTSNWRDHSERESWEKRKPDFNEIHMYEKLLDELTIDVTMNLERELKTKLFVLAEHNNGKMRVAYLEWPFSNKVEINFCGMRISQDILHRVLDLSRTYIGVLYSHKIRWGKVASCCSNEHEGEMCFREGTANDRLYQLLLNLIAPTLSSVCYPNIDDLLAKWLYDAFIACVEYRELMQIDPAIWWRDAWWKSQERLTADFREKENRELFKGNVSTYLDVYGDATKCSRPLFDFERHTPKYGKSDFEIFTEVKNGVKWFCRRYPGRTKYDKPTLKIDLTSSEVVGELLDGAVEIPDIINGEVVEEIFSSDASITKPWKAVVIKDSSEKGSPISKERAHRWYNIEISEKTFQKWENLETVDLSISAKIGDSAFANCINLKRVSCHNDCGVGLGEECFSNCGSLEFFSGIFSSEISTRCFFKCGKLRVIGRSRKSKSNECENCLTNNRLGEEAFYGCNSLANVRIEGIQPYIGRAAFEKCTFLKKVEMVDEAVHIGPYKPLAYGGRICERAFYGCASLNSVHLLSDVRVVCDSAFEGCPTDLAIHHDGDGFWFIGEKALGPITARLYPSEHYYDSPSGRIYTLNQVKNIPGTVVWKRKSLWHNL